MKKALFFDIDGTLVSFNTHKVPQSTVAALRKAHSEGHKIIISTGRPYMIINNLGPLQDDGLIDGYITMNGAYCFIGDNVLYRKPISREEVATLSEICRKKGYACIFVSERDIHVVQPNDEVKKIFNEFLHVESIPPADFKDVEGKEIYQMTAFFDEEDEEEIKREAPGCEFNRWYPTFVDITAKGTTKAKGIGVVMQHLGLPETESIAFGDGGNDVPMLEEAGIGVAMGNSTPEVQAHADFVTDTVDNDGIAKALKTLHLAQIE